MGARACSAYAGLVPSAQREAATGLPYRRPGAQRPHHLGAERVARGGDGSQRLRRLAHRRAAPSARSAVRRAPSAEREAEIRLAAGAGRAAPTPPAPTAERVARGGASWHAGAARASSRSSNAGRLLPASATLTSFVGGINTMSPAPGRRTPMWRGLDTTRAASGPAAFGVGNHSTPEGITPHQMLWTCTT